MQRNTFLKLSALGLGGLFLPARLLHQKNKKVIIVGAGMAGASAAYHLALAGFEVEVVEARNRIGGRVHSLARWNTHLEMGAHWIHRASPGAKYIYQLANSLEVKSRPTNLYNLQVYAADGAGIPLRKVARFYEREFEKQLMEIIKTISESDQDISLQELVRRGFAGKYLSEEKRDILNFITQGFENSLNTPLENASAKYHLSESILRTEENNYLITEGYDKLVQHLLQDIQVHLNSPVISLKEKPDRVQVMTSTTSYEADFVIITVPSSLLRQNKIDFQSPLPEWKRKAFTKIQTGLFNKVYLKFAEKFWDDDRELLFFQSELKNAFGLVLNYHHYTQHPIWVAMPVSDAARWIESQPMEAIKSRWVQLLHKSFPNKNITIEEIVSSRWGTDSYALGAYSYAPVGCTKLDFEQLAKPVGKIHFAGEATVAEANATVHGAYLSGLREAQRIIAY